jgi:O-antigen ligase
MARRYGEYIDFHNLYLWVLTEVGLVGAVPFFLWIASALRSAWNARSGPQEAVPLAILVCILIANMANTMYAHKYFWLGFAYVFASGASSLRNGESQAARHFAGRSNGETNRLYPRGWTVG